MCLFWLTPTYPPKAAPVWKPAVAEPIPPLTGTLLRKPPPPTPPNSHCCAKLAAAPRVSTRIDRRSVFIANQIGTDSAAYRHAIEEAATADAAEFPLLRETRRGSKGEHQNRS